MTVHVLTGKRGCNAPATLAAIPDEVLSWLAGELGPDERLAMREIAEILGPDDPDVASFESLIFDIEIRRAETKNSG